jgi:hypothetical protein
LQAAAQARITTASAERDAFLMLLFLQNYHWECVRIPVPGLMLPGLWLPSNRTMNVAWLNRLTQYRMTIEAGEALLSQRPKILRDPSIKGNIQLIPEALKLRLPSLLDRERIPPQQEVP